MSSILFFLLLTLTISALVAAPIFRSYARRGDSNNKGSNHVANDLIERKQTIYNHIKDIDFDYQMGKLSQEDYEALRQQYKQEAVSLLQKIDRIEGKTAKTGKTVRGKKSKSEHTANFCWLCGTALTPDDRFCANCGNQIK